MGKQIADNKYKRIWTNSGQGFNVTRIATKAYQKTPAHKLDGDTTSRLI